MLGGNRSGKTFAGTHETLAHLYGYRFWEVPDLRLTADGDLPHRDTVPPAHWTRRADSLPTRLPAVGMVVSGLPRLRGIGQNIFPAVHDALPESVRASKALSVLRGAQSVPDWLQLPNGSKLIFATAEQEAQSFEGFKLDFCWVDEPIPQNIYSALIARLHDSQGPIWFTLTPLGAQAAWLYAWVVDKPADIGITQVAMRDNPAWKQADIDRFIRDGEFNDQELRARIDGEFTFLGDRVYAGFNPEVHVIAPFPIPQDWILGCTIDPHHARPPFILWWAYRSDTDTYYFTREWPPGGNFHKLKDGGLNPRDLAAVIRNAEGRARVTVRVADPRFGKAEHLRHGHVETSFCELLAEEGVYFDANVPGTGVIETGHQVVAAHLRYDKEGPHTPDGRARLYVFNTCENVINGFMRYGFTDTKDMVKGMHRHVSEEFKDSMDAVRYTLLYPIPATDKEVAAMQSFSVEDLKKENAVLGEYGDTE